MNLLRLLLQTSWTSVTLAAFTGLLSGASSAGLIALTNFTLRSPDLPKAFLVCSFVGCCFVLLIASAASQILLARLSQDVILDRGKSTLVKLITGLYIPETGVIQANGEPVSDENREWYRQQFSVVFSDFYLFERLLGLGNPDLDHQTQDYLVKLQLERKVEVKEGVLSTTALSQGQRKRLALLTAYLENRPIYVFDQWASDQDPVFKEFFYTQLLPELKNRGKTVLAISHDDHYFHLADRVVKLDYGKVEYEKCSH